MVKTQVLLVLLLVTAGSGGDAAKEETGEVPQHKELENLGDEAAGSEEGDAGGGFKRSEGGHKEGSKDSYCPPNSVLDLSLPNDLTLAMTQGDYHYDDDGEDDLGDDYALDDLTRSVLTKDFWVVRGKKPKDADAVITSPIPRQPRVPFWLTRGKKGIRDYIPNYWGSNQNVWGKTLFSQSMVPATTAILEGRGARGPLHISSGWESNQNLWGKRDDGPFWVARGKKQRESDNVLARLALSRAWGPNPLLLGKRVNRQDIVERLKAIDNKPFWLTRGKRAVAQDTGSPWSLLNPTGDSARPRGKKEQDFRSFWAARGKRQSMPQIPLLDQSNVAKAFWVPRGKKETTTPYWVTRGKKAESNESPSDEAFSGKPFWAMRGKKEGEASPFWVARGKEENENPFWVVRGKKDNYDNSFWVARGKKENNNPFWVARGKKETDIPFWVARGKKESDNPFWVARGKKDSSNAFWVARGKKEQTADPFWRLKDDTERENNFWVGRGKKLGIEQEVEGGPFWVLRGRRGQNLPPDRTDEVIQILLNAMRLKEAPLKEGHIDLGPRGKKNLETVPSSIGSPATETFLALRG